MRLRGRTLANVLMVSAFAIFCVGGISFLAIGLGLEVPGKGGWTLDADFQGAQGLVTQADVDLNGVKVGRVVAINNVDGGTRVEMKIDSTVKLRQDVRAVVRPKSQLGEKYVELVRRPGSQAPPVAEGYRIPVAQTGSAVEIDDVLNGMDPQARAAFTETLRQLGVAVDGQQENISSSIQPLGDTAANFRPIADTAAARQAEIDRILTDLARIMAALADEQDSLGQLVDSGNTVFGAISSRDAELAGTIQQADTLFASLDTTFADLTPSDRASLEKAPGTIQSGRNLLALTNPEVDRLLPELLLAQVNYPSNQLNVTSPEALALAYEWESAFAQNDINGHSFRFTNINGNGAIRPASPATGTSPAAPAQDAGASSGGGAPVPGVPGPVAGNALPGPLQFLLGTAAP